MGPRPILVAGYARAWHEVLADDRATERVVFVGEQPAARTAELIRWDYRLAGAADRFFLAHRDLDPVAILPGVGAAVPFAARLAERYGVPGAGFGAATLLSHTALLRTVAAEAGFALAERFHAGDAYRVALLVRDGEPVAEDVSDTHVVARRRPVALGLREQLVAQTRGVLDAVGFGSGFVRCDWIVVGGVAYLVDCGGRMPGDLLHPARDGDTLAAFLDVMRGSRPRRPLPVSLAPGTATTLQPGAVRRAGGCRPVRRRTRIRRHPWST
jgi:hypothetical protein